MMPADKFDTSTVQEIVASGDATDPGLLEWVQDLNWPVARVLAPFLASAGSIVAPGIRLVLESSDDTWKSSLVSGVVVNSKELIVLLQPELKRIANAPTYGERAEGLDQLVIELLKLA
ncbi:DUF5071 domain-containing protein [Pseudoduganella violaceinigra]|uniref:DUF5071 domain-containing protein n=1 Tax=Pseudoduganella violaceinigra TaxID=246602 RepID=UPI001B7FBF00|nr:DUF5071 domain-containing protein [Pseudoduganella violaceinigra]